MADDGGLVEIGIAYSTEKRRWLEWAAQEFELSEAGRAVRINLVPVESQEGARAIVQGDQQLHVWAPASSIHREGFLREWRAKYADNPAAKHDPIVKAETLALTPMVIVMWKSRYEAFTASAPDMSLRTLIAAMHTTNGWGTIALKPEWGRFKLGHTRPGQSNSGLMTLILLAHDYCEKTAALTNGDVVSSDFQEHLALFGRGVAPLANTTDELMKQMILRGPSVYDALLVYESVAIDYLKDAAGRWEELQVAYPKYNVWNDNPYYILETPWSTDAQRKLAETFLSFLMSEPVQLRTLAHGFRPGNPSVPVIGPGSPFEEYAKQGLQVELPEVCEPPSAEVIENLLQSWKRNAAPR